MDERLLRLFRRQQASGFADLREAHAFVTLPISESLLNDLLAEWLPTSLPIKDLHVAPQATDRFAVRGRLGSSALLPPLKLTLAIDRQPEFPDSPILVLRLEATGLLSLAGPALRLMNALPAGVRVEHDRIYVDLRALAALRGLQSYLELVRELRVNALDGKLIVSVRASVD